MAPNVYKNTSYVHIHNTLDYVYRNIKIKEWEIYYNNFLEFALIKQKKKTYSLIIYFVSVRQIKIFQFPEDVFILRESRSLYFSHRHDDI